VADQIRCALVTPVAVGDLDGRQSPHLSVDPFRVMGKLIAQGLFKLTA
jgi:hypothetical protein